uniref:Uncharacterized protein n=1 Tax=Chromera velia CCMP2878 TaxID=1169474 RepID=A0A0G4GGR4_9ALVE|eukprot:Cvel_4668.t1-p1 / transcript=Cvel_4668.t1 / gene=Cvel_4668 / organism=Chromera_velia_CCMP2878 / gene_product=hypothetical protein / transcript_product=hypothetical protein / location=Cvel_scaffold206:83457-83872(-) / protein_length=108 / sequence_SO=supercontig / SO=protein_coding / is_pseudo=false
MRKRPGTSSLPSANTKCVDWRLSEWKHLLFVQLDALAATLESECSELRMTLEELSAEAAALAETTEKRRNSIDQARFHLEAEKARCLACFQRLNNHVVQKGLGAKIDA